MRGGAKGLAKERCMAKSKEEDLADVPPKVANSKLDLGGFFCLLKMSSNSRLMKVEGKMRACTFRSTA